jgi:inward rectifier potassium channel
MPSNLDNDLGFGSVVASQSRRRLLNRDGSFNVVREGLGWFERVAPYHALLSMTWPQFLAVVLASYLLLNVLFGVAYWLCGPGALLDPSHTVPDGGLTRAFFFSVETFGTIGYGAVAPSGLAANVVMSVESLATLLVAALTTGLVFARFSRPTARIRFSRNAVVAPYQDGWALEFRLANTRRSEIVQVEARVLYSFMEDQPDGRRVRRFEPLALERERVVFFPLAWTIVHPIDERSPLRGLTHEDLVAREAEVLVLLSGLEETFSTTVHARTSYRPEDVMWHARFVTVFNPPRADGTLSIDIGRLHVVEPA